MKDPVTWELLGMVVGAVIVGGTIVATVLIKLHQTSINAINERITFLSESRSLQTQQQENRLVGMDARIQGLELFDAGLKVLIEHLVAQRKEMMDKLEQLMQERNADMRSVKHKLDRLLREDDNGGN